MAIVLWVVAAIAILVVVAISLPYRLRVRANSAPEAVLLVQGTVSVAPWFTLVDSRKASDAESHDEAGEPDEGEADETAGKGEPKKDRKRKKGGIPAGIPAAVRGVLREIRIVRLWANGAFGLGDPADTGLVYGLLTPLIYGARGNAVRLNVRPDFDRLCAEGDLDAIVQVTPVRLVPVAARFAWANLQRRFRAAGPATMRKEKAA